MSTHQLLRRIDTKCLLAKAFLPYIVSFGFRFGEDHTGDEAIFFQFVLADSAVKGKILLEHTQAIQNFLRQHLDLEMDLCWYFNWRSESEMEKMWDKYQHGDINNQDYGWEDVVEARQRETERQLQPAGGNA